MSKPPLPSEGQTSPLPPQQSPPVGGVHDPHPDYAQQAPPPGHYGDAKAQAKAAKAYAKAQRPWYVKKRYVIPGALVALIVVMSVATNGDSGSENGTTVSSSDSGSAEKVEAASDGNKADAATGSRGNPYKLGQTIELEGTQYTVRKASTRSSIGGDFGSTADGTYVVVNLTIENKKNETKIFTDTAAAFIASDDTEYKSNTEASIYLGDDALILDEMQPDLPKKGQLVFDVPKSKIAGGVLRVEDIFGGGEAYIGLKLK